LEEREAFYGGAGGGGKSSALLAGAAQYVETPGYAALVLRKTFPDLSQPGALIDVSKDWWGNTNARWIEAEHTWRFPAGSSIKFGHMETEDAKRNYLSSEYQYVGYDELTSFSETQYRYLFTRQRRKVTIPVPLRMRSASNPGGPGHDWVRSRFVLPGDPSRPFVPASLYDNPHLNRDEYRDSLLLVDPIVRAQMLEGNWDVVGAGATFNRVDFPILSVPPMSYERLVRSWDLAATAPIPGREADADFTVGALIGRTTNGILVVLNLVIFQGRPGAVERTVRETALADGEEVEIFMEQEPGAGGKIVADHYATQVLADRTFTAVRSTGSKVSRATPLANQSQAGNVAILPGSWNLAFYEQLDGFPFGPHDDMIDAVSLGVNQLSLGREVRQASADVRALFRYLG
jgi:predicted phage terminase large subunit-like protein